LRTKKRDRPGGIAASALLTDGLAASLLRLACDAVANAGVAGALRELFSLHAASLLVFRLLFLVKVSLPFCVGVVVSRHESSISISKINVNLPRMT
jgi:hypothetical protein